jgi:hypothetical protein
MARNHSEIEYDTAVPQQPGRRPRAPEQNPFMAHGLEGTMGTEQAMINKVIEDSLKS